MKIANWLLIVTSLFIFLFAPKTYAWENCQEEGDKVYLDGILQSELINCPPMESTAQSSILEHKERT